MDGHNEAKRKNTTRLVCLGTERSTCILKKPFTTILDYKKLSRGWDSIPLTGQHILLPVNAHTETRNRIVPSGFVNALIVP